MPFDKDAHKLPRVTLLRGHTSPETAYVIEDYPYGRRLRCKRRVWVETAAKGAQRGKQRFVYQTTNPKRVGEPWNTPHADQYRQLVFLVIDHGDDDHVKQATVSDWGPAPEQHTRHILNGMYRQMNDGERTIYDAMVSRARRASSESWDKHDRLVALTRAYIAEHGKLPERDDRSCLVFGDERFHQYDGEWRITVAAAVTDGSENWPSPADDEYADVAAEFADLGLMF